MMSGDFLRCLRRLNPHLGVCSFGNNSKLAGIYYLQSGEYQDVCGVDKNEVPEYAEYDEVGHIVRSGWRRVVNVLLYYRLTTRAKVRQIWPSFFERWTQEQVNADRGYRLAGDPANEKFKRYCSEAIEADREVLTMEQFLDVATDIRAKDSSYKREQDERDRWFLKTWQKRGGNRSDKPRI